MFFQQCRLMWGVGSSHLESNFEKCRFFSLVNCPLYRVTKEPCESGHRRKLGQKKIDGLSYPRPNLGLPHWQSSVLQPPVVFCSEMSTLAPTDWATAGSCVQTQQFKTVCCSKAWFFFCLWENLNKEHLEVFESKQLIFHNTFQALKSTQAVKSLQPLVSVQRQSSSSDFILDISTFICLTAEPSLKLFSVQRLQTVYNQVASSCWNVCMRLWKRNWNLKISSRSFTWSLKDCKNVCNIYQTVQGFFLS